MGELPVRQALSILGLSEYEARAYEALVRLGEAKPSVITRESGVPQSKVYDTLNRLVNAGLVRVIPERPKRYAALTPDRLKPIVVEKRKELAAVEKRLSDLGEMYASQSRREEGGELWFLPNRKAMVANVREALHQASATVHAIDPGLELMAALGPSFQEARLRGVDVRVVAGEGVRGRFTDAETMVRFVGGEGMAMSVLLIDDSILFLGVDEPPMALGTRLPGFLAFGRGYVDYWWAGRHAEGFKESFYPYLFTEGEDA